MGRALTLPTLLVSHPLFDFPPLPFLCENWPRLEAGEERNGKQKKALPAYSSLTHCALTCKMERRKKTGGKQKKRTTPFSSFLDPISQKSVFLLGRSVAQQCPKPKRRPNTPFLFGERSCAQPLPPPPFQKPNIKGSLDSKVSDFTAGGGGGRHSRCLVFKASSRTLKAFAKAKREGVWQSKFVVWEVKGYRIIF